MKKKVLALVLAASMAASMAAFLLSSGKKGKRYALPNSEVMIHQPLGWAEWQAKDIKKKQLFGIELDKEIHDFGTIKEGDKAGWVQGPTSETSIYIVKSQEKPCWTLHVRNDKDEWQDVVLPTADNITSIKGVAIENGVISTDGTKEVSLYYGTANDKVKFGNPEIEYPKGYLFTSSDRFIWKHFCCWYYW